MVDTIYEKGDSLHSLALKAREWFNKKEVEDIVRPLSKDSGLNVENR